jgi:hypothetical protein
VGNTTYVVAPAVVGGSTDISLPNTTQVSNSTPISDAANISVVPTLTWNSFPGATAYVVFLSSPVRTYRIYLPGTSSNYTIPNFAAVNAGLQPSTSYTWQVYGIKSNNLTPDAFAEPSQDTFLKLGSGLVGFESYTSKATSFTTAP